MKAIVFLFVALLATVTQLIGGTCSPAAPITIAPECRNRQLSRRGDKEDVHQAPAPTTDMKSGHSKKPSGYADFGRIFENRTDDLQDKLLPHPKYLRREEFTGGRILQANQEPHPKLHTIFSAECSSYFDWQTVALIHSFDRSRQSGSITRLLTCTEEDLKQYKGHDLAPTHYVPSMSRHPLTGDWYPKINKPAAVLHWISHVKIDAEFVIILDADMLILEPIIPSDFNAGPGRPVSTPYHALIGCENELAKIHSRNPDGCRKVGGSAIVMHLRDVRRFALVWMQKTQQLRADKSRWSANVTGDDGETGWFSSIYGYSFAAAELNFRHVISNDLLLNAGDVPELGTRYRVIHYSRSWSISGGSYSFEKSRWTDSHMVQNCDAKFPDPPDIDPNADEAAIRRDSVSIRSIRILNEALQLKRRKKCPPRSIEKNSTTTAAGTEKVPLQPPFSGWVAGVMTLSAFLLIAVMWMIINSHKKASKKRRRDFFHGTHITEKNSV